MEISVNLPHWPEIENNTIQEWRQAQPTATEEKVEVLKIINTTICVSHQKSPLHYYYIRFHNDCPIVLVNNSQVKRVRNWWAAFELIVCGQEKLSRQIRI